jgi:DnaJ-class molecular chaperone
MRFLWVILDSLGACIDFLLTRKCWVCGGSGIYEGETCLECKGDRRI